MSHDFLGIVPAARVAHDVPPPLVEPQAPVLHHSLEDVRAVDAAFGDGDDQSDAALGTMGLCLSAPWLMDVLADALRPNRNEDTDGPPHPRARDDENE